MSVFQEQQSGKSDFVLTVKMKCQKRCLEYGPVSYEELNHSIRFILRYLHEREPKNVPN